MRSPFVLFLLLALTNACGDNAYRCQNPENGRDDDWAMTRSICNDLKEDDCWCSHRAEFFCDPYGDNIAKFKEMCDSHQGYDWNEC